MEKDKKQPSRLGSLDPGLEDQDITTRFIQEELSDILERAYDGTRPVYDAADDIMQFTTRSQLITAEEKPRLSRKEKFQSTSETSETYSPQELQEMWDDSDRKPETGKQKKNKNKKKKEKTASAPKKERTWWGRKKKEQPAPEPEPVVEEPPKRRFLTDEPKPKTPESKEKKTDDTGQITGALDKTGAQTATGSLDRTGAQDATGSLYKTGAQSATGSLDQTGAQSKASSAASKKPRFSKASAIRGSQTEETDRLWKLEQPAPKPAWWKTVLEKYKAYIAKKTHYGWVTTLALCALLVVLITGIWSLFVAGPARMHAEQVDQAEARIAEQVPGIQGISRTVFAYITYEGYTDDTLYWFDVTGELITSKPISTLNYEAAKQKALNTYGVDTVTIQLAYGYTAPVYEIQSEDYLLLLDYDTLSLIYERRELT